MQSDFEQQIVKKKRSRSSKGNSDSIPQFLQKTYEILENPVNQDIISWNEDGTAFIIKKVNEFQDIVLPKSFKHANIASFIRQLNMYDFHKTRHDNNENEFKHKLFKRGFKEQLSQIKRKTNDTKEQNSLSLCKQDIIRTGNPEIPDLLLQMTKLSTKQNELEKLIKILIKQNEKIQKENKYLWTELMKNKKNDGSEEQLMKWIMQNLQSGKQNTKHKPFPAQNQLLMLKSTGEHDDQVNNNSLPSQIYENNQCDQLPNLTSPSLIPQNLEASLEKLSKPQILSLFVNTLKNSQKKQQQQLKQEEDDLSPDDDDYTTHKKVDLEEKYSSLQKEQKQENNNNQLVPYSDPYNFRFEDGYLINESPNLSRKCSYFDHEADQQFFEEQE